MAAPTMPYITFRQLNSVSGAPRRCPSAPTSVIYLGAGFVFQLFALHFCFYIPIVIGHRDSGEHKKKLDFLCVKSLTDFDQCQ